MSVTPWGAPSPPPPPPYGLNGYVPHRGVDRIFQRGGHRGYSPAALPRVSAGSVVLSRHEGPYSLKTRAVDENTLQKNKF